MEVSMGTYYRFYCNSCNKFCKTEIKSCLRPHNMEAIREFINRHYFKCTSYNFMMVDEECCEDDLYNEDDYDIGNIDEKH